MVRKGVLNGRETQSALHFSTPCWQPRGTGGTVKPGAQSSVVKHDSGGLSTITQAKNRVTVFFVHQFNVTL